MQNVHWIQENKNPADVTPVGVVFRFRERCYLSPNEVERHCLIGAGAIFGDKIQILA